MRQYLADDDALVEGVMSVLADDKVMRLTEQEVYQVGGAEVAHATLRQL